MMQIDLQDQMCGLIDVISDMSESGFIPYVNETLQSGLTIGQLFIIGRRSAA